MNAYQSLEKHFGRIGRLSSVTRHLYWDSATMMPSGGAQARAEQIATLKVLEHDLYSAPQLIDWFAEAQLQTNLDPWQSANLKEMRREHQHAVAIPSDLVEAHSKAGSICENTWRTARAQNDLATLSPLLEEVFSLTRKIAQAKAEALNTTPYEALLDEYEPGGSAQHIDAIFGTLAEKLPSLIERVLEKQARGPKILPLQGPFDAKLQRKLGLSVMETLGFDFNHGRLDTSSHPFCDGIPDDVRITTRYNTDDFLQSLMGVVHETGHALYERGLPAKWSFQPVGNARGMSLHESQSLLMEMQACRSRSFVDFLTPQSRAIFNGQGPAWEADNLYRIYTHVERSLIRVEADEVTYPAHVILRYRLERAILDDNLRVNDLPGAWNAGMKELLGIEPPNDRLGFMQDIHWMEGALGYFPTYTLGAMTAAQLFDAATRHNPQILPCISRGDFAPLRTWLIENIHSKGSLLSSEELLIQATGKPLDANIFMTHLERRYLEE